MLCFCFLFFEVVHLYYLLDVLDLVLELHLCHLPDVLELPDRPDHTAETEIIYFERSPPVKYGFLHVRKHLGSPDVDTVLLCVG